MTPSTTPSTNLYHDHVSAIPHTSKVRLIVLPLIVAAVVIFAPSILQLAFSLVFPAPIEQIGSLPGALSMVVTVVVATVVMAKISNVQLKDLGVFPQGWLRQSASGAVYGFVALAVVVGIIVLAGATTLTRNPEITLPPLIIGLVFFLFQGTWEELVYRSYLMPHFSKVMGDFWAIVITSVLFMAFHGMNPGMKPLPILNLLIASVVFSLLYYCTGSLLVVGIAHGVWNFSQGFIFGAQVSGNSISSSVLFSHATAGKDLISGGAFGFEGGLVTTGLGLLLIGAFFVSRFIAARR